MGAIKVGVENPGLHLGMLQRFDLLRQALGEGDAAAADADEGELIEFARALQNFVRQPHQGAIDFGGAHQLRFFAGDGHGGVNGLRVTHGFRGRGRHRSYTACMPRVYEWFVQEILDARDENTAEYKIFDLEVQLSFAPPEDRAQAVELLRAAAEKCDKPKRAERLRSAARDVAHGNPTARNQQGLTLEEARAANSITAEEWEKLAPYWPTDQSPEIPHLGLWDLYPGLVVRVAQGFKDYDGQEIEAGKILHFRKLDHFFYDDGYTLTFAECVIRLSGNVPANQPMVDNAANEFLDPVPCVESLQACFASIRQLWPMLKLKLQWQAPIVRGEIDGCQRWLDCAREDRGDPPGSRSAPLLPSLFGERTTVTERLIFQINFPLAAQVRCPDGRTQSET